MIRRARVTDVKAIHALVRRFADEELMLPLSFGEITDRLRDFHVLETESGIIGTIALHVTWDRLVEVRSLAVAPEAQKHGYGRELVGAALRDARELGAEEVFTLTYVPEFFERLGFTRVDRSALPHKVWQDCVKCTKFPDCGEIALTLPLGGTPEPAAPADEKE
jgi:amino-acid N-acetyltransferase